MAKTEKLETTKVLDTKKTSYINDFLDFLRKLFITEDEPESPLSDDVNLVSLETIPEDAVLKINCQAKDSHWITLFFANFRYMGDAIHHDNTTVDLSGAHSNHWDQKNFTESLANHH